MAAIKTEQLNPFLVAARQVLKQVCDVDIKFGPISRDDYYINGEPLFIMIGVTGEISGQVCIVMENEVAKDIAVRMMQGREVNEIDELARSAISELGNMIMGNAATLLSNDNIDIEITPPTLITGNARITSPDVAVIKVPVVYQSSEIKMCFLLRTAD